MEAGQRYYVIVIKKTEDFLRDYNYNALRFVSAEKAQQYLEENCDNLDNYKIDCLRW